MEHETEEHMDYEMQATEFAILGPGLGFRTSV